MNIIISNPLPDLIACFEIGFAVVMVVIFVVLLLNSLWHAKAQISNRVPPADGEN